MHASAAAPATAGSEAAHASSLHCWRESMDDAVLTGNEGTEADVTRIVATDEGLLLEEEEDAGVSSEQELQETLKLLLAGGIAGGISKTATAPLARLTILYQVQGLKMASLASSSSAATSMGPSKFQPSTASSFLYDQASSTRLAGRHSSNSFQTRFGVLEGLQTIIRQEGVRSLWKGNGVTIVHRLPYSATNFWVYEMVNEFWKERIPAKSPLSLEDISRRFVAGGVAGLTACTMAYPLDLVRTLLAAQTTKRYYRGIGHALATIVRESGPFGLYRGLSATLMQVGPSLSINYAAYETARSIWLSRSNESNPSVVTSLACGSLAGLISSTMTFPLDLVRRRMQLQGQAGTTKAYHSYGGAFRSIVAAEGWRGLYSGILPEYYKVIPGVAIAFCTYEIAKRVLGVKTNLTQR